MSAFLHSGKSPGDERVILHIPAHLYHVQEEIQNLLTLDVHAIAYATYLRNQEKPIPDKDIYEVSYLLAWLYAINSNSYKTLFQNNCTLITMEVGTCEIVPRKTYTGEVMTPGMYLTLDEDEYEDDEEYAARAGNKHKFALAAEKAKDAPNPDESLVSAYLRVGPDAAFRSFIRRSFVREDLVSNCLAVAASVNCSLVDKTTEFSHTEHVSESMSLGESLRRCMLMSTYVFETIDDSIESDELEQPIKDSLEQLKGQILVNENAPPARIGLTRLNIYAPLALFLRESDILMMIEQAKKDMYVYNSAWKDNPPYRHESELLLIYANLNGDLVTVELREQNDITAWLFLNAEVDNLISKRFASLSPGVLCINENTIKFSSSTGNIK